MSGLLKSRRQELAGNVSGRAERAHGTPELIEEMEALAERTAGYEENVSRVASGLGMGVGETVHAVADLIRLRDSAQALAGSDKEAHRRVSEKDRAQRAMESFEAEFGGPDGLERCVALSEKARAIDDEASEIRRCISEDGLDPDAPVCPAEYLGASNGKDALKRRLEELNAAITRIERSEELERLFDRRAELAFKRSAILREGVAAAVAMHLAEAMVRKSSPLTGRAWNGADAYLSFIMDSDCSLDRRDGEFYIRSGDAEVPVGEAGSGISAAACLSLRMAAVENLSGGALLLILDEALSGMDPDLRRRACSLLSQLSGRLQVVVLTCDPEVKGTLSRIPGANVVNMPRAGLRRLRDEATSDYLYKQVNH
jgi:DNA repair exonuclease SbcCD ATPase subunit